jgi:hypothetical protein
VIGLVPISPVTEDLNTSVTPVFDRITKLPETPRSTAFNKGEGAGFFSDDIPEVETGP